MSEGNDNTRELSKRSETQRRRYLILPLIQREKPDVDRIGAQEQGAGQVPQVRTPYITIGEDSLILWCK